jgi:hypothetical protein
LEEWVEWAEWAEWEDSVKVMKMMNKATWMTCKRKKSWKVPNKRNKDKKHDANDVYLAIYLYIIIKIFIISEFSTFPSSYPWDIYWLSR